MTQGPRLKKSARQVKIEGLVNKYKDLLENARATNESLIGLASKTEQAEKFQSELEEMLEVVNNRHDEYMEKARGYIDSVLDKNFPTKNSRKPQNSASARNSSKASTARRKHFIIARIRREEFQEENKTADRIAEKVYEIELAERKSEKVAKRQLYSCFLKTTKRPREITRGISKMSH